MLLRKRADLRAQNKQGKTPADVATGEAKPLLERKLAEAAAVSAAAEAAAAPGGDSLAEAEAAAPSAGVAAAAAAAVELAAAGPKRSLDAEPGAANADAKRPKVILSFYAGEDEGEDA